MTVATEVSRSRGKLQELNLPSLHSNARAVWAVFKIRVKIVSRYPGMLVMDVITPLIVAMLPILIGVGVAGDIASAEANFAANTGTTNFILYMVIGTVMFSVVSFSMWFFGFFIRREQQNGTLEAIYITTTSRATLLAGTSLYVSLRSSIYGIVSLLLVSLLFGLNPLQGDVFLAIVFMGLGLVPIFGMNLFFGSLILKFKEVGPMIGLLQWVISFLMGMYFPVTVLPLFFRTIALMLPPTWVVNGIRASLLDTSYLLDGWYMDIAVLAAMWFIIPAIGFYIFTKIENNLRKNQGIGTF
ncbi:MAG: ABC transporter permease [Candidatus Hodarchaeales archaeon]